MADKKIDLSKINLRKYNFILGDQSKWSFEGIRSVEKFAAIIDLESARAERNNLQFSLVAFSVGDIDRDPTIMERILNVLNEKVRLIDEVGWLDSGRVGVLLPSINAKGAQRFAEEICENIGNGKVYKI